MRHAQSLVNQSAEAAKKSDLEAAYALREGDRQLELVLCLFREREPFCRLFGETPMPALRAIQQSSNSGTRDEFPEGLVIDRFVQTGQEVPAVPDGRRTAIASC